MIWVFIAKKNSKGEKGFSVYIAGGLGAKPQVAYKLYDFVPEVQVYNIAKASKTLFDKYGNRKNKHAARLRFLFNKLGPEEFTRRFEEEFKFVKDNDYPPLEIRQSNPVKEGFLEIPLFLGDIETEAAGKLAEILNNYGEDILRVTKNQNLIVRNVDIQNIEKIRDRLKETGFINQMPDIIKNSAACAGASTCRLGICLSRGLFLAIKDILEEKNLSSNNIGDINIKISGCPNSCGQHHIADIGFIGVAKRNNNQPLPSYAVLLGGIVSEGKTRLAERIGVLPAKNVPLFFMEFLGEVQKNRDLDESFYDYFNRIGKEQALLLVDKYSHIPDFNEDKSFYIDWSSEEIFKLTDKIEGECSAGLFDLIEWEFSNIDKSFSQLEKTEEKQKFFRSIVLSASRALLITKGLEPKSDVESVVLFKEYFIGKHIDLSYRDVINKYLNSEAISKEEVENLSNAVRELYDSMDNSLRFPELQSLEQIEEVQSDKQIFSDFRGVACPMNFVKTKLVLETMTQGEILEILLDDGAPIENVPPSVKSEGHKVIKQEKIEDYWSVVIEKGRDS